MPLAFMDKKQHEDFVEEKPFILYEYYDKAGPRIINGYPMFPSFSHLTEAKWEKCREYLKQIIEAMVNIKP